VRANVGEIGHTQDLMVMRGLRQRQRRFALTLIN
jgi:hypothetical protein